MLTATGLSSQVRRIGPVWMAFIGSLILSWFAVQGRLVNRDGVVYLDTALQIVERGVSGIPEVLGFNSFPLFIAYLSRLLPFGVEATAYLVDGFLMAGACALVVHWVRWRVPDAGWAACLTVLSIPAFNEYRGDILREYGFWFFSLAGLYLASRWNENGRWRTVLVAQGLLLLAMMFRFEAVIFFVALFIWQLFSAPRDERIRKVLQVAVLPLLVAVGLVITIQLGATSLPERIAYYWQALDPSSTASLFLVAAQRFQEAVLLFSYSREESGYMLLFGLLSVIPVKFVAQSGVFLLVLIGAYWRHPLNEPLARWQPLPWAFLMYLFVLVIFLIHSFFVLGRYLSLLHWFAIPIFSLGLLRIWVWRPKWQFPTACLLLVAGMANVVSISPQKEHVVEAAAWLAREVPEPNQVCLNDARIAYYAGWPLSHTHWVQDFATMFTMPGCRYIVVETRRKRLDQLTEDLVARGYVEKMRFLDKTSNAVIIAMPAH